LNAYLDTSVLVSMFTTDAHTPRVAAWLPSAANRLALSDWGLAEFSSALGIGVRVGRITADERQAAEGTFEMWLGPDQSVSPVEPDDVRMARSLIRAARLPLRAGDAMHVAIARRLGCALATFDIRMAEAATELGVPLEDL
jgi:predicted nucleic acid-binding protein